MTKIIVINKIFSFMKSSLLAFGYTKFMAKTGMTYGEMQIFKESFKSSKNFIFKKIGSIFGKTSQSSISLVMPKENLVKSFSSPQITTALGQKLKEQSIFASELNPTDLKVFKTKRVI